jgi:NhaA family Na+:H+ antiporter
MKPEPRGAWGVFAAFVHSAAGGSVILLAATLAALVLANSPWRGAYDRLLHASVGMTLGSRAFTLSLHHWINDGLMALFFFVVGLEIKREVVVGHLSDVRLAVLPGSAAIGGMVVPAAIYALLNAGGPGAGGWGIPMATDIAFALGVLALVGAPLSLKVFLTALAIVDDLGAVLVIAIFYTETIRWPALLVAAACLAVFFVLLRAGVRRPMLLLPPVIGVWAAVFASGLHATVAGVLVALLVPMKSSINPARFVEVVQARLTELTARDVTRTTLLVDEDKLDVVMELHEAAADLRPPGLALERLLHPIQAYAVLPLFAFFNAGLALDRGALAALTGPIALGVSLGLLLGKPLGIMLFSWLAVRSGLATLGDLTWRAIFAASLTAAIGFTMSLFITELAFPDGAALGEAKIAILAASLVAGVAGYVLLRLTEGGDDS